MGAVEDLRKLLQDLVTPDLKALDARVVALEQTVDLRFTAQDKKIDLKFELLDKKIDSTTQLLDKKIEAKTDLLMAEIRNLALVVASNHASILHVLDLDRRLERIESERASKAN